jgi:hypothetical protein
MWPAGQEAGEEQSLDYVVWRRFLEEFVGPSMARSKSGDLQVQLWKDWGWTAGAYIKAGVLIVHKGGGGYRAHGSWLGHENRPKTGTMTGYKIGARVLHLQDFGEISRWVGGYAAPPH